MTDVTSMMPPYELFLTDDELRQFTGRKLRSAQATALRDMGVPFFQNPAGRVFVARAVIEGRYTCVSAPPAPGWKPDVLSGK